MSWVYNDSEALTELLAKKLDVLIVDGGLPEDLDTLDEAMSSIKHAITAQGGPLLIFTTNHVPAVYRNLRRFVIYDMRPR